MKQTARAGDRLAKKSDAHSLVHNLVTRYDMSVAEAECLTDELRRRQMKENLAPLLDGQIWYTAVGTDEPAGKPLAKCRTLRIRLTLNGPEELAYRVEHGLSALQKRLVSKLCFEAYQQGALLAQEDLCRLLYLSRATVQRTLADYRRQGDYVPTRGTFHDIGPGVTHKYQAVRLYLIGLQPTEIAFRLCHQLSSIERYLDDFCRVAAATDASFGPQAIARFTGHSQRLIGEYLALLRTFSADPDYREPLEALRRRSQNLLQTEKGGLS